MKMIIRHVNDDDEDDHMMIMFQSRKPLLWERLKWTKRFQFVDKQKLIHVIGDDLSSGAWQTNEWSVEELYKIRHHFLTL